jgi:hypothetical protein
MKYLIFLTVLLLFGCATVEEKVVYKPVVVEEQGFPEGDITDPPFGYIKHCIDYPDSIFCE